jgi:hypothetical protein
MCSLASVITHTLTHNASYICNTLLYTVIRHYGQMAHQADGAYSSMAAGASGPYPIAHLIPQDHNAVISAHQVVIDSYVRFVYVRVRCV